MFKLDFLWKILNTLNNLTSSAEETSAMAEELIRLVEKFPILYGYDGKYGSKTNKRAKKYIDLSILGKFGIIIPLLIN